MLTRADAERIAHATRLLRPTWDFPQLMAVLGDERICVPRHAPDVAAALAWLALDRDTREPTRLLSGGPWWGTVTAAGQRTGPDVRHPKADDCDLCNRPKHPSNDRCAYRPRNQSGHGVKAPPELYALLNQTRTSTTEDPA